MQFVNAALQHAAGWAKVENLPMVYQRQFQFVSTSEWYEPVIAIPNYQHWLQGHFQQIAALPETQECIRRLWARGALRHLLPKNHQPTSTDQLTDEQIHALAGRVFYALVDILQRTNTFEPRQEQILETYARFRAAWTSTTDRHVAIIPLLNFQTDVVEPIRLSSHYTVSTFTG